MELNRRGNNYSHASAVVAQINNVVVHVGHIHNHVKAVIRQLELSIFSILDNFEHSHTVAFSLAISNLFFVVLYLFSSL